MAVKKKAASKPKPASKNAIGQLPRSQGIDAERIEFAYVNGSTHEQYRIEEWGRMNRRILRSLGKPATEDGTVSKLAQKQLQRTAR